MMKHLASYAIPLIVSALLAGCQTTPAREPFPTTAPAIDPPVYRIQAGDLLGVRFQYMPQLDDEVTVRPDGMISLMPVDDVPAAGLTPAELDKVLTERYTKILNQPDLSVIVRKFSAQRAFVGGEVKLPGMVSLDANLSALNAVMTAGGPLSTAAMDHVLLIRRGPEENSAYVTTLDLRKTLQTGVGDVSLQPFDVIYVPRTIITDVNIFVEQYINQLIPRALGFQFLYNVNREVQVVSDDQANILFSRQNIR